MLVLKCYTCRDAANLHMVPAAAEQVLGRCSLAPSTPTKISLLAKIQHAPETEGSEGRGGVGVQRNDMLRGWGALESGSHLQDCRGTGILCRQSNRIGYLSSL